MRLGLLGVAALLLGAVLAAGSGESSRAGTIGPTDFGSNAVVQTFDTLTGNYFGTYGPLVLNGVTYATSLPDIYRIPSGSDCLFGQCFGTYLDNASFTITLDNPVERVGGYLIRDTFQPFVILYDASHAALDEFAVSNAIWSRYRASWDFVSMRDG